MAKFTTTEIIVAGLKAIGYTEKPCASRKYHQFEKLSDPNVHPLYVGKAGALRYGRTVTDSVSMERTDARRRIVNAGQKALGVLPTSGKVVLSDADKRGIADEAAARGAR